MLLILLVVLSTLCVVSQPVRVKPILRIGVTSTYHASALWADGYSGWFP